MRDVGARRTPGRLPRDVHVGGVVDASRARGAGRGSATRARESVVAREGGNVSKPRETDEDERTRVHTHQVRSIERGTYVEDAFASLHEFSRAVAGALEEASSSEAAEADAEDAVGVALSRAVWELLDVYFVTRGGGFGVGTDDVVAWYRDNAASLALGDGSASGRLRTLLETVPKNARIEEVPGYWDIIVTMVALGWVDATVDLLVMHSAWAEWRLRKTSVQPQVELMEAAIALLRTLPKLGGEDGAASVPQYTSYRNEWLRQVKTVLAEGGLFNNCWGPTADGVRNMLLVLSGDERTITANVGNWIELMLAQLQHVHPTLKIQGEHESLARTARQTKGKLITDALDSLLMYAIAGDSQGVISICSRHLDSWFMAYSTTMLSRAGGAQADVIRRPTASGASQSELYMLEYCSSLATSEDTRELAVRILAACCSQRGTEMTSATLMRLAIAEDEQEVEDDAPAKAAHALATEVGLTSTSARIAKMASERARSNGYIALAFDWLRRSNDTAASDLLARGLVYVGERRDAAAPLARVDNFMAKDGSGVLVETNELHENAVDFYRERAKFDEAMKTLRVSSVVDERSRAAAKTAADALIAALAPCSTPHELWTSIIVDAVPLFESAFSMRDLFDRDSCRLLAARARFAADLSRSSSASTLDAISARPPTHIDAFDLTIATAAHAIARLTSRVAFET
jgi:nuclear pore complex protein Nup85